jgi:hypothetical protein
MHVVVIYLTHLKGPIIELGAVVEKGVPTPCTVHTFSLFQCVNSAPMLFRANALNDALYLVWCPFIAYHGIASLFILPIHEY